MIGDEDTANTENFEAAFDRLAEIAETPGEPPAEPVADEPVADEPVAETPEAPAAEPAAEEEAAAEEAPAEAPPPEAAKPNEDLLERLARMVAEKEQHVVPPEQQIQQPTPQQEEYYSKEETELLTAYDKEWPDVSRAEAIKRRAEYKQLVNYVFQEVAKELTPLLGTVNTLSERTHLADLQSRVENYAQDRNAVIEWVAKQPAYLQPAYKHVIQQGTVDEVADLINRFRQETGATRAAPAAAKPKTDLPAATKQAAAALAPVSSKRSAVIRGTDPNDFESAFEEFAGKL